MIGTLLDHSDIETMPRYTHLTHDAIRDAAERVARSRASDIL